MIQPQTAAYFLRRWSAHLALHLLGEETGRYEEMRGELLAAGYVDTEHPRLRPGQRVRHRAQQWPEAFDRGTGTIIAVMEHPESPWAQDYGTPDVEVIVLRDRDAVLWAGQSRLTQMANYHVDVVTPV
jgi:hypothetical protein